MCRMMVLSYNHVLHGIGGDCMGLGRAYGIAGELCSSRPRTSASLHMPISVRSHPPAQQLWLSLRARADTQDAVEHCRRHTTAWTEAPEQVFGRCWSRIQVCYAASAHGRARLAA